MKKTITMMTLLVGATLMSCAQSTPAKVTEAFKSKFPNAKSVEWEKENDTEWEAEFKLNGIEYSANFGTDGTWKETEHEIKVNELPESVKNTLANEFSEYEIEEAEMVETPDFNGYEVEIEKGEETMEVVFDKSGKVIKKKIENEENEDDEDEN